MNIASQRTLQQKEWATIDSVEWENIDWNTIEARVNKLLYLSTQKYTIFQLKSIPL